MTYQSKPPRYTKTSGAFLVYLQDLVHHNFGNDVQHFIVTAAAARRTMRYFLHVGKDF